MKTKFFKKLSFVLVVAMVLSVFAPAASAFAAKKPALNSTKKYLHLGRVDNGQNEFNFNIKNKQKGSKYQWESSNEAIAVVNEKNGVTTAKGVGKATISVTITDKDGKDTTLKAQVIVRDNIETVKISNPVEKVGVGEAYDYNRSFITEAGSTKKTSAITRWEVEPNTATIDDKGVFVATEPGEYTVTALSFQSKARYNSWLDNPEKYADYVLDTDTTKVTVGASMTEAKQVDLDTLNVVFDSVMDGKDIEKNIIISQLVGETKVKHNVAKVEMGTDDTVATIDLYIPFAKGSTYVVEYPDMDSVSFVAATTNSEDVVDMEITTTTAFVGELTDVKVKLLNADGVDITNPELSTRVTMESDTVANVYFDAGAKKIQIFEKGVSATVKATYHSYKHDTTTGEEINNVTKSGVVMGIDKHATNVTGLSAWTIVSDGNPNFNDVKKHIAVDDQGNGTPQLFVKLNTKTGNDTGDVNSKDNFELFEFKSSNENILIVDKATGLLYPVQAGNVTIIVSYGADDKTPVATVPITVSAKASAHNIILDSSVFSLSNSELLNDSKDVKVTVKDQLGRDFNFDKIKIERVSAPVVDGGFVVDQLVDDVELGENGIAPTNEYTITFGAKGKKEGTYVYRITVGNVTRAITVTVLKPTDENVAYHTLEVGSGPDMKINTWDGVEAYTKAVDIKVVARSKNGVALYNVDLAGSAKFRVEVKAPHDPAENFSTDLDNDGSYTVVKTVRGASGSTIVKAPIGTYVVTAYESVDGVDKVVGTKSFTTSDTQPTAVLSKVNHNNITVDLRTENISNKKDALLLAAVNDAFEFAVDGDKDNVKVIEVDATGTASSIAIKSVKVTYEIKTGYFLEFTVNLNGRLLQKK
jgi:uncharacterized protein YlxP (DUF503 family)